MLKKAGTIDRGKDGYRGKGCKLTASVSDNALFTHE
jgi:hypothetical protein